MKLEEAIERYYAPKKGNDYLVKLIEAKLNEDLGIPVPEMTPKIATAREKEARDTYRRILSDPLKTRNSASLKERIATINQYLHPERLDVREDLNLQKFVAVFTFIQEFEKIIREYDSEDPKMAGMRFEMLTTLLVDGVELFGLMITDTLIREKEGEAPKELSIKFISKFGTHGYPIIDGSFLNLMEMLSKEQSVIYVLCLKNSPKYEFRAFEITPDNFMGIINHNTAIYERLASFNIDVTDGLKRELEKYGITPQRDKFNFGVYEDLLMFKGKQHVLAKFMFSYLPQELKRVNLLTPAFETTLRDLSEGIHTINPTRDYRSLEGGVKQITWDSVICKNEGAIVVSREAIEQTKKAYESTIYENVFNFFKNSEKLLGDVRDFFSSQGINRKAEEIGQDIGQLQKDFYGIAEEMEVTGQMKQEAPETDL
jgi:hypothetical protein